MNLTRVLARYRSILDAYIIVRPRGCGRVLPGERWAGCARQAENRERWLLPFPLRVCARKGSSPSCFSVDVHINIPDLRVVSLTFPSPK